MNTKGFSTLVQGMAAAIQAGAAGLVDFTIGSILRALVEAVAQVALWLQGLVLTLLATTRAATSSGSDLDSFMADFGLTRLAAISAAGQITLTRFTSSSDGFVAVGALVATTDGSQQFTVTADPGNPFYSSARGGYVLAIGTASITVTAAASIAGGSGNVAAGAITIIVSEVPGIDTVANAAPFTAGQDAETDSAFRTRFRAYMRSLRTSNDDSIEYAISNVQAGLRYAIVRNKTYPDLRDAAGYFFIVVDDGSGSPAQSLLDAVFAAVLAVRACGVQFGVFAPNPVTVNVNLAISVTPASDFSAAASAVQAAVTAYTGGLIMQEQSIPITRLAQVAYGAHSSITNVPVGSITINGAAADLALTAFQVPEAGTVTVISA
jgi:Uncharacterized homolog of phage Mu protein gp47